MAWPVTQVRVGWGGKKTKKTPGVASDLSRCSRRASELDPWVLQSRLNPVVADQQLKVFSDRLSFDKPWWTWPVWKFQTVIGVAPTQRTSIQLLSFRNLLRNLKSNHLCWIKTRWSQNPPYEWVFVSLFSVLKLTTSWRLMRIRMRRSKMNFLIVM